MSSDDLEQPIETSGSQPSIVAVDELQLLRDLARKYPEAYFGSSFTPDPSAETSNTKSGGTSSASAMAQSPSPHVNSTKLYLSE